MLPERVIGDEAVFFQSEHAWQNEYAERGTLKEWQDEVAARCVDNPLMMFSVSAAFAGCLLEPAHMDGGGFHLFGPSSSGKTTIGRCACSVWGGPKYARTWRSTANGIEAAAVLFNHGLIFLDEMSQADPTEVSQVIYMIANGQGKQRANRFGTARKLHQWRVIALSTGEQSIETHLEQKRLKAKAGQDVRLLNIPTFGKHGAFNSLHGCATGRAFSDLLQKRVAKLHGTAGPAFLEWLIKQKPDVGERLETTLRNFKADELQPQEARAARRFALVALAGELAREAGITGWLEGKPLKAALTCFEQWRQWRGKGDLEKLKVLQAISEFIERHGDSRFSALHAEDAVVRDRAGYWRTTQDGSREYLFNSAGLREALSGFDFNRGIETLIAKTWLKPYKDGRSSTPITTIQLGKTTRFYVITPQEIEESITPITPGPDSGVIDGDQADHSTYTNYTNYTEKENKAAESKNTRAEEDGWEVH